MTFLGLIGRFCNKLFYWCLLSFDIKVLDAKQPRVKTKCLFFVAYILPLWGTRAVVPAGSPPSRLKRDFEGYVIDAFLNQHMKCIVNLHDLTLRQWS